MEGTSPNHSDLDNILKIDIDQNYSLWAKESSNEIKNGQKVTLTLTLFEPGLGLDFDR